MTTYLLIGITAEAAAILLVALVALISRQRPWHDHALTGALAVVGVTAGYYYAAPTLAHIIRQHFLT